MILTDNLLIKSLIECCPLFFRKLGHKITISQFDTTVHVTSSITVKGDLPNEKETSWRPSFHNVSDKF